MKKREKSKIKSAIILGVVVFVLGALTVVADSESKIKANDKTTETFNQIVIGSDPSSPVTTIKEETITLDEVAGGTYASKKEYESNVVSSDFYFNAVAPHFKNKIPDDTSVRIAIKTSVDGTTWSDWMEAQESDGGRDDKRGKEDTYFAEFPIFSEGNYAKYKLTLESKDNELTPEVFNVSLNFIDSRLTTVKKISNSITGLAQKVFAAETGPTIISRSGWGSPDPDNTLFEGESKHWPAAYEPVTHMFFHHTAGSNNPSDPAATVRAIWQYHAYTRGWGDIGYNFVVDQYGNKYEGRYGGDNVIGGHVLGYNTGSMGVAVLGNFMDYTPPTKAVDGLVDLLGFKASKYSINTTTKSTLNDKSLYHISGHRDAGATSCPGTRLYSQLGSIRTKSADRSAYYSLRHTAFSLNFSVITFAQAGTATLNVFNNSPNALSSKQMRIAAKNLTNGAEYNFTPQTISLAQGEGTTLNFSKAFTKAGAYRAWPQVFQNNKWNTISNETGSPRTIDFVVESPQDVIVVTDFTRTPASPVDSELSVASVTIKNNTSLPYEATKTQVMVNIGSSYRRDYPASIGFTLSAGASKTIDVQRTFDRLTTYSYYMSLTDTAGSTHRISPVRSFVTTPTTDRVAVSGIAFTPSKPTVGQTINASFNLTNNSSSSITIASAGFSYTDSSGRSRSFTPMTSIALAQGQTKNIAVSGTIGRSGAYSYRPYFKTAANHYWLRGSTRFSVVSILSKIKVSSFSISPTKPLVGQDVTARFTVTNTAGFDITFDRYGVEAWYGNSKSRDFPSINSPTVLNGESKTVELKRFFFVPSAYSTYVSFVLGGVAYRATPIKSFSVGSIAPYLKATEFTLTPASPQVNQSTTSKFTYKNTSAAIINFASAGVQARTSTKVRDFTPSANFVLNPGESKTVESARGFNFPSKFTSFGYIAIGPTSYRLTSIKTLVVVPNILGITNSSVTPSNFALGETSTGAFTLTNNGLGDVVVEKSWQQLRGGDGKYRNFGIESSFTLIPGESLTVTKTRLLNYLGSYTFRPYYQTYGTTYRAQGVAVTASHLPLLSLTSPLATSPDDPTQNSDISVSFSIKNTDPRSAIFEKISVLIYNSAETHECLFLDSTIGSGETSNFNCTKHVNYSGKYSLKIRHLLVDNIWRYPFSSSSMTVYPTVANAKEIKITSSKNYLLEDSNGTDLVTTIPAGRISSAYYVSGKYFVITPGKTVSSSTYVRFKAYDGGVMKITSYKDVPSWNTSLNDNTFRSHVVVRYSNTSNKLWAINELPIESYLKGVAETSSSSPAEHLKTMSVAARSYAYCHTEKPSVHCGKHPGEPFDLKNSRNGNGNDQQYRGYGLEARFAALASAVGATAGKVVTYGGTPVLTPYYSRSDGRTRSAQEAFGWTDAPWLKSVSDPDSAGKTLLGHGVGLAGDGSVARAGRGTSYANILKYYYTGTALETISNITIRVAIYGITP